MSVRWNDLAAMAEWSMLTINRLADGGAVSTGKRECTVEKTEDGSGNLVGYPVETLLATSPAGSITDVGSQGHFRMRLRACG